MARTLTGLAVPAVFACSVWVAGCGGGGTKECADVFTTPVSYGGQEVVVGCFVPGTYTITASVSQTAGTCLALFDWQAASGSAHQCTATMSGDASSGYDIDFRTCSLPGSIHVAGNLSTFTGSFGWTAGCGSGTTTFQNITKK